MAGEDRVISTRTMGANRIDRCAITWMAAQIKQRSNHVGSSQLPWGHLQDYDAHINSQRELERDLEGLGTKHHEVEKIDEEMACETTPWGKNKVWIKQAESTPGGKTFHRAEKQRRDQQRVVEENLMIDENKRIECLYCRSKFVIGNFFTLREICSNLSITERNRQNNSRIRRRGGVVNNSQRNQEDDIPAAQPCSVSQPEQQLLAQQEEEIEWENVMKEIDVIFGESVETPQAAQQNRVAARGKWRNMSAMPAPKRQVGQNTLECIFCHSVFPKADKCAIHMRTCAAMPYDMWIARVRLSCSCPEYAEQVCPHYGTKFTTNKGFTAHANQCRKRREKVTTH